jgi:hypothetical protein
VCVLLLATDCSTIKPNLLYVRAGGVQTQYINLISCDTVGMAYQADVHSAIVFKPIMFLIFQIIRNVTVSCYGQQNVYVTMQIEFNRIIIM